jgi:hypothetical protein
MIYEINSNQIPLAMKINNSFNFIKMSTDSTKSLVKIENIEGITIINSYEDESLNSLLVEERWQQSCMSC